MNYDSSKPTQKSCHLIFQTPLQVKWPCLGPTNPVLASEMKRKSQKPFAGFSPFILLEVHPYFFPQEGSSQL